LDALWDCIIFTLIEKLVQQLKVLSPTCEQKNSKDVLLAKTPRSFSALNRICGAVCGSSLSMSLSAYSRVLAIQADSFSLTE
jgi:hypothetical protein